MNELVFPIAAVLVTFVVVIPALTFLSRAVLAHRRASANNWGSFGSETTFAWLVAPTLLPVLWLTSSALHQSEPTTAQDACLVPHAVATTCSDAVLLLGILLVGMGFVTFVRALRERPQITLKLLPDSAPMARRVLAITANDPKLRSLRVVVATHTDEPVFTLGWFRPLVVLDACFVNDSDDSMLRAGLLHEWAHVAGFDTLRGFIARLSLSANPLGFLLMPDFQRWQRAREAQCDGQAVSLGGDPLALAAGIVRAVRFRCSGRIPQGASMLCGHDAVALKLRLALLMDGPPMPRRTAGHLALAVAIVAAIAIPHLQGAGALELFHFEVEQWLHSIQ